MEGITGRIAVGEDESTAILLGNLVHLVTCLDEEVDQLYRMSRRAVAVVNLRHVCYVTLVALVEVHAIPAGLEVNLSTETCVAIRVVDVWSLLARLSCQAGPRVTVGGGSTGDSLVVEGQGRRVIATCASVARDHTKSRREGCDGLVNAAADVVKHRAGLLDVDERPVLELVVEERGPVSGLVVLNFTTGTRRLRETVSSSIGTNVWGCC